MPKKDLYEIMGLHKNASSAEIHKQFRKLSMVEHPDKHLPGPQRDAATKKYQEISAAHDILKDDEKRRIYDMTGDTDVDANMGNMFGGMPINPEELINIFAGGMGGLGGMFSNGNGIFHMNINGQPVNFQQTMRQPKPIEEVIEITLEDAYRGLTKRLEIERTVITNQSQKMEKETLYIKIPSGIDHNEIITIEEKGHIIDDVTRGSVRVTIKVINNTLFIREGIDLIYKKTISLKDALCGFNFEMKYIDGRSFNINNSSGNIIEPGHKKIISNMGMIRDEHQGNLTIEFTVEFPYNLESSVIEKLKSLL